jgi:Fur family ferric uptake transcriptional regulator
METTVMPTEFSHRAASFWRERGGRMTPVREILCKAIVKGAPTFTAEDLLDRGRKLDRGISSASVYRTVADLVVAGLLREIRNHRDQRSFIVVDQAESTPVGHVVCADCQKVIPLDDECVSLREGAMLKRMGFSSGGMHLQIEASCESMQKSGVCENPGGKA